jgi:hypothetical protein
MKLIEAAHLHYYRAEAHYEFGGRFRILVDRFPAVRTVVVKHLPDFDALRNTEGQLIDRMIKSNITEKLVETDRLIDSYIVGIRETVSAATRHFDENVAEAAKALLNRIDAFGRMENKSYEEATTAVKIFVSELQNDTYRRMSDLVGITEWLRRLEETENEFENLFDLRNIEYADRPEGTLKVVRREVDKSYHGMVDRIDATATLDETGAYTEFIKQLNEYITYLNEHTHQHAKKDIKNAEPAPIPQQSYTGFPITPVPQVLYVTSKGTVTLELGKDYNLSYKDNVNVGNAQCIIHGKGAYRGTKTVTFIIAHA